MNDRVAAGAVELPQFPHSFRYLTVHGIYWRLVVAAAIPVIAGVLRGGVPALILVVASVTGAVLADLLAAALLSGQSALPSEGRAVYLGLVVAALLPVSVDPVIATAASLLTVFAGVWLFGGPGRYWIHPSLVGIALAGALVPSAGTVLEGGGATLFSFLPELLSQAVPSLEHFLLEPLGVRVPREAWSLILGETGLSGSAMTAGLVWPSLLGAMIVFGEDLAPAVTSLLFLLSYLGLVWLLGGLPLGEGLAGGDPLQAMFMTNAVFVLVFVLADPGSRPSSRGGMAAFGILAGSLAALFWVSREVVIPATAAVFIAGFFIPLLDILVCKVRRW
ncbi:Na+-translocating ferredoxin:NAD+ oxidoreductase RNF, RnfD subunit [Alkalispirochaeta americana]|uniref:Na+-translocating ferredoxin:NAD+ oxidoreductase RNF, RnfD subunit n=1 Tax=Alkalispirochaeta americana TaxID=159291 RepID=A0A1N6NAP0_9SPIO|nr:RnfABCDGE type electron transport complex subunit D [Alkalispirochaeta americana]SIP89143.1 Na+-translocating ferredoxin:NAD+ oxidoreductase RNF, RnfD subunit [Alkalispirochaeta americana]